MDAAGLAAAVAELAAVSTQDFSVEDMLRRLCEVAARFLPVDGVGVMAVEAGRTRFVHASSSDLWDTERLQEVLQTGPCRDAADTEGLVQATSRAQLGRWPQFAQVAERAGIGAVVAVPLLSRGGCWGVLDLYWADSHVCDVQELQAGQMLADVAVSYIVMAADRQEAAAAREQLAHRLLHDQLTGLAGRELFHEMTVHALAAARRHGTSVAVLFVDLDRFKAVNDTYGHAAGDVVLHTVAQRLRAAVRASDSAGRVGGDEFVILCEDLPGTAAEVTDAVNIVAARVMAAIGAPILVRDRQITISASIGIAVTAGQPSAPDLTHLADMSMYEAKLAGPGRVQVRHHQQDTVPAPRRDLERGLPGALDRGELRVFYQPIVSGAGQVAAAEALLRWEHPERGLLAAGEFIDLAESTGAIIPIGRWVIEQATAQLRQWQQQFPAAAPWTVFCNVSPQEVTSPGLAAAISDALTTHHLTPDQLALEITETQLGDPGLHSALEQYRQQGHPLAVDDFGVGYSSLSRLIDIPAAFVKIDRSVTAKLPDDVRARKLLDAVATVASKLDLRMVAEGVETDAQARYLTAAGCELQQGYHHGHPQTAHHFTTLLKN